MIDLLQQNFFYTIILFLFFFTVFIGEFPYLLITLKLFRNKSRWKVVFAHNKESRFYLFFISLVPSVFFLLMSLLFAYIFYLFFNSFLLFLLIVIYLFLSVLTFIRLVPNKIKRIDSDFILLVFSRVEIEDKFVQKLFFDYPKKLAWIVSAILTLIGFFILLKSFIIQ